MPPNYRSLFPVNKHAIFLNNAAESPLNNRSKIRLSQYFENASQRPFAKPSVREPIRKLAAQLFGASPVDYALINSTGMGINLTAAGLPWQAGDNVVLPAGEHWNSTYPWLALREKGIEVRLVPLEADGRVDPNKFISMLDAQTRVVSTTAVRFDNGFRADLKKLSAAAHAVDALFVVDGIQAAGVIPLNVEQDGIDILSCAGFKWLLGTPGTGFMYASRRAQQRIRPAFPGMFATDKHMSELNYHPDARRYETGSLAYSLFYAWEAGLELLGEIGINSIYQQVLGLTDQLIAGLNERGIQITSPIQNQAERSAILTFTLGSTEANTELINKLKAKNIIVTLREGYIRISPNFFNNEDDIQRFFKILDKRDS